MATNPKQILALDVGSVRIGVALASGVAKLARPLTTLDATTFTLEQLASILSQEDVGTIVVGLPRGLDGQETNQTASVRTFADRLAALGLPVILQDEALTSHKAKIELEARGASYSKADVDALAATYILEDYLTSGRVSA